MPPSKPRAPATPARVLPSSPGKFGGWPNAAPAATEITAKIEQSTARSKHGAELSAVVAQSFATIQERVARVDELVGTITRASDQQADDIRQVVAAVATMDQVTQRTAASSEETAAAAAELDAQTRQIVAAAASLRSLLSGRESARPRSAAVAAHALQRPVVRPHTISRPGSAPAEATA